MHAKDLIDVGGDDGNWIDIKEFEKVSEEQDEGVSYNYFLSFVNLLADLCLNRNYIAMDKLATIYPYDLCFEIISDPYIGPALREGFARLIKTLWIDRFPFLPLTLPNKIRVWD